MTSYRRMTELAACACLLGLSAGAPTGDLLQVLSVNLDRPTLHALGVQVLVVDDDDRDASITVRYRDTAGGGWRIGPSLLRVFPETVTGFASVPQFGGSVFDLRPDTEYQIELHIVDPDGVDTYRTVTARTRPVPRALPASPQPVAVNNQAQLLGALQSAGPGQVITVANGVYTGQYLAVFGSGTPNNPIVIRGQSQAGTVIDGGACATCNILEVYGSYVHVENMTFRNAFQAIRFQGQGSTGNVARRLTVTDVIHGIGSNVNQSDFYICDNAIEGRLSWPWIFDPNASSHWDDRGVSVTGSGHVVCHNRLKGFGDPMVQLALGARSFDFYGNDIYDSFDGMELEPGEGNARAVHNRFTNVFTAVSMQPIYGGPAYVLRNVARNAVHSQVKLHAGGGNESTGVLVYHNTFLSADLAMNQQTPVTQHNFLIANNLFIGPQTLTRNNTIEWTAVIDRGRFDYNGYYPNGGIWLGTLPGNNRLLANNFAQLQALNIFEQNGVLLTAPTLASGVVGPADPTIAVSPTDFSLHSGSNAIDRGMVLDGINRNHNGAAPDLGAYETGCPVPVYGPRPPGTEDQVALVDCGAGVASPGVLVLDGLGGVHAGGGAGGISPGTTYFGFDIARDLELSGGGAYVLDGMGGVHPGGGAPPISPATPYFGFDVVRDLELSPGGAYVLDGFGAVHSGAGAPIMSPATPYFGFDVAVDLELVANGYYVLDEFGGVHEGGGSAPVSAPTPYFGFRMARDLEIVAPGFWVLDGYGGVHSGNGAPAPSLPTPYFGIDIARDLEVAATGFYVLDGFGGVHPGGGAPTVSPATPYFGWDIARDLELR